MQLQCRNSVIFRWPAVTHMHYITENNSRNFTLVQFLYNASETKSAEKLTHANILCCNSQLFRVVAEVWEKDVWDFQTKSGSSGSSRLFLGVQVLPVFSFISWGKSQFKKCLAKHLEVPDILLPDIRGRLIFIVEINSNMI